MLPTLLTLTFWRQDSLDGHHVKINFIIRVALAIELENIDHEVEKVEHLLVHINFTIVVVSKADEQLDDVGVKNELLGLAFRALPGRKVTVQNPIQRLPETSQQFRIFAVLGQHALEATEPNVFNVDDQFLHAKLNDLLQLSLARLEIECWRLLIVFDVLHLVACHW
ncbi:hypothetical protein KCU65_g47, partial [Aureobasidium melanogenum]